MVDTYSTGRPTSRQHRRYWFERSLIGVLVVLAAILGVAYWQKYNEVSRLERRPADEAAQLLAAVGGHIKLPAEKATIATVEDKQKLAGQAFFTHAQNGDKVLIYPQGKKAILYRPSTDKIIEVAHLNLKAQAP